MRRVSACVEFRSSFVDALRIAELGLVVISRIPLVVDGVRLIQVHQKHILFWATHWALHHLHFAASEVEEPLIDHNFFVNVLGELELLLLLREKLQFFELLD